MKKHGDLSEKIRLRAIQQYVQPARRDGRKTFTIRVKDLMKELENEGFPPNHPAQFCSALRTQTFLLEHDLVIDRTDGPPSKVSTTVVFHYKFGRQARNVSETRVAETVVKRDDYEAAERAFRLTEKLRGLMKDEIAAHGGTEGFMRWVRSDEDEEAA